LFFFFFLDPPAAAGAVAAAPPPPPPPSPSPPPPPPPPPPDDVDDADDADEAESAAGDAAWPRRALRKAVSAGPGERRLSGDSSSSRRSTCRLARATISTCRTRAALSSRSRQASLRLPVEKERVGCFFKPTVKLGFFRWSNILIQISRKKCTDTNRFVESSRTSQPNSVCVQKYLFFQVLQRSVRECVGECARTAAIENGMLGEAFIHV